MDFTIKKAFPEGTKHGVLLTIGPLLPEGPFTPGGPTGPCRG